MIRTRGSPELDPPVTPAQIAADLARLGLAARDTVLVHSSLRALAGRRSMVVGGAVALIEALQRVVGPDGNVVMPTFSADHSDPSSWRNPPPPASWWPVIREHWPAFRRDRTPSRGVGRVPETFRAMADVHRSDHPQSSFAAWGAQAARITADHPLDQALDDGGPLGTLHAMDARVVMLGCGWSRCTCFHLAEHRMKPSPPHHDQGAPVLRDGRRHWVRWRQPAVHADDFEPLGDAFEARGGVRVGLVGRAPSRSFSLREAVAFAVPWLQRNR